MEQGRASETAYVVLQGIVSVAQDPSGAGLVSDKKLAGYLKILNNTARGRRKLDQLASPFQKFLLRLQERLFLPGISRHYVIRKKTIEEMVRGAIAEGAEQVVNLGAGFDMLMSELSGEFPHVKFAEIDHPATFVEKQVALSEGKQSNLSFLPVDLSEVDVAEAIQNIPGFEANRQSCFICEGVLMYLQEPHVTRLFSVLSELCGKDTKFVFTAVPAMNSPNTNATWLLKLYLKTLGEPLLWSLEATDAPAFLEAQGYQCHDVVDGRVMQSKYLTNMPTRRFHLGEFVVLSSAKS